MLETPDMVFERVGGRFVPVLPRRDRQPDDGRYFTIAGVAGLTGRSPEHVRRDWLAWYGDDRPERYFKLVGTQPVPCESFNPDALDLAAVAGRIGWSEAALIALHETFFGDDDDGEAEVDPRPPGRRGYKADTFAVDNPLAPWAAKLRRAGHGRYGCRYTAIVVALNAAVGLLCDARDRFSPDRPHPEDQLHREAFDRLHAALDAVRQAAESVTDDEATAAVLGRPMGSWPRRNRFDRKPTA